MSCISGPSLQRSMTKSSVLVDLWDREEVVETGVRLCQNWRKKLERCIEFTEIVSGETLFPSEDDVTGARRTLSPTSGKDEHDI